jgi:hypothetical protein
MVVGGHSGTGFQNWRNSEFWNRVPGFNNLGESWEIVPVFSDISNPGTKFQNDTLARESESWNLKNIERGRSHSSFLIRANSPEDSFEK